MEKFLDITPGSVSILGLMNDKENHVQLLIDEDLLKEPYIGCHPCINTSSLKINMKDMMEKIIPAMKHEPIFVKLGTGRIKLQLTNLYVTLSSIMPKIKQTDTHFNHVPACLISVFIQFLFALPLLYQCKYTLKYNEEAQQDCCYNVGPGADQFSIGFNQSRNRTIDQYTKQGTKYISYTTGKKCTTDDCGGNSVHFKAGCLGGGTCHGIQAVADSADGSKETGKNICLHLCFLNISPIRVADC